MKLHRLAPIFSVLLILAGCGEDEAPDRPPPATLTQDAMGHFCGMSLAEHSGPKGQVLLRGTDQPVWFSSARDAIAFSYLAEEPRAIRAIYVSDMAKAESWDQPGVTNWVEARDAFFVLGSRRRGGMGAEEAVPFSDRAAAERFAAEQEGRVVAFTDIPRDWALGGEAAGALPPQPPPGAGTSAPSTRHSH